MPLRLSNRWMPSVGSLRVGLDVSLSRSNQTLALRRSLPRRRLCHHEPTSDRSATAATLEMTACAWTLGCRNARSRQELLGIRRRRTVKIGEENMQERLKEKQSSTSSRASSFFIENILGNGPDGHRPTSNGAGGICGVETASARGVQGAHQADTSAPAPVGSDSTVRCPYGESSLQWCRDGTDLNFGAVETPQSK